MSRTLQNKETSVQNGYYIADVTIKALERLCSVEQFSALFSDVRQECADTDVMHQFYQDRDSC
jgi:hypothetical protein